VKYHDSGASVCSKTYLTHGKVVEKLQEAAGKVNVCHILLCPCVKVVSLVYQVKGV